MERSTTYNGVKIAFLGHASFRIEWQGRVLYVDPYQISGGPKAHAILITHNHFDHEDSASIKALSKEDAQVIDDLAVGEKRIVDVIEIEAMPAYNINKFRSPGQPYHPKDFGRGYLITVGGSGVKIYHAGDTDNIPEMANLAGRVDIALLPIGGTYTMDEVEAAEAVKVIKPKIVIPMHYGDAVVSSGDAEKFSQLVGDMAEVRLRT